MKAYTVLIAEKAKNDMYEITRYISEDLLNTVAASRVLQKFEDAIVGLSTMPERHEKVRDEWAQSRQIRKLLVDNYIIFYTIDESEVKVNVIRILYMRRDWINLI
jgi:addiction module RelE/StbE family toxin